MSCVNRDVVDPFSTSAAQRRVVLVGAPPEVVHIQVFFRGVSLGGRQLEAVPGAAFRIGSGASADAPAPAAVVTGDDATLLSWAPGGFVVHVTPAMRGFASVGGRVRELQEIGVDFVLDAGAVVRIECGEVTFLVEAGTRVPLVPRPRTGLRWAEHRYTLLSGGGLALFLLVALTVPPESSALAGGMFDVQPRLVRFDRRPPEVVKDDLSWLPKPQRAPGDQGQAHTGQDGQAGDRAAPRRPARWAQRGGGETNMTKEQARHDAQQAGLLGLLKESGGALAVFDGAEKALGDAAETALGELDGTLVGNAFGLGGIGLTGTGAGGAGTGAHSVGKGGLRTFGIAGDGSGGPGYGGSRHVARLDPKKPHPFQVTPGDLKLQGTLDREIVRRIIRRHLNEVKYCYEQELARKPDLGGRVVVQFTIGNMGQVLASVLQSSDMANARVENCIVQAVRRWEFPQPHGRGGLVFVSYPFLLTPAGGR